MQSERESEVHLGTRSTCCFMSPGNKVTVVTATLYTGQHQVSMGRAPARILLSRDDQDPRCQYEALYYVLFGLRGLQPMVDIIIKEARSLLD